MAHAEEFFHTICYVCGARSEQFDADYISRPTQMDHRVDLDGRPTGWKRILLAYSIHSCPHCGYSAFDISVGDERVMGIVNSAAYQQLWADDGMCAMGRCYLCLALLVDAEESEPGEAAARRADWELWAAWACEEERYPDAGAARGACSEHWAGPGCEEYQDPDGARACRQRAAESLASCLASGGSAYNCAGTDFAVIADCHRRCAEFAAAREWAERGLRAEIDPRARVRLEYELSLIAAADTAAHLEDEAPGLAALEAGLWAESWGFVW